MEVLHALLRKGMKPGEAKQNVFVKVKMQPGSKEVDEFKYLWLTIQVYKSSKEESEGRVEWMEMTVRGDL